LALDTEILDLLQPEAARTDLVNTQLFWLDVSGKDGLRIIKVLISLEETGRAERG
jgi:hypothetical protein